jgi:hypothetical protein
LLLLLFLQRNPTRHESTLKETRYVVVSSAALEVFLLQCNVITRVPYSSITSIAR